MVMLLLGESRCIAGPTVTAVERGKTLINPVVSVIAMATLFIYYLIIVSSCLSLCRTTVLRILGGKFHATTSKYSLYWRHA